ncbi:urease accessory protein UreF [Amorphus coralli]|uniref:urease accessory protein UreF n=1 Tax=Amorphus coralli TaxID=340680 RepID=UPI00037D4CC7|nr:urease accessory protein UreF [Amorphus coralli]
MTTEAGALYRLMAWLSPSYPVGAFTLSHGLEWSVEDGTVTDLASLAGWVEDVLAQGGGRQDAILFVAAWRARRQHDIPVLAEIVELAAALNPSKERRTETLSQGDAFRTITETAWPAEESWPDGRLAYPVAVAIAAADHGIALAPALVAYLHAFSANIVSAGVRLIPLGQSDGQRAIARLEPAIAALAAEAETSTLDDLGGCALFADIASMRHETQYTRLFRT